MNESIRRPNLADEVYGKLKRDLSEFRLLPGDRFTEADVASRTGASRTPVREALYRLQQEGHLEVHFRNGWQVLPLDFDRLDELYELRILLERTAILRLESFDPGRLRRLLDGLVDFWLRPVQERETDPRMIADRDEEFHSSLVSAAGNREMARVHADASEKIRIVRRLDFTQRNRVEATFEEHGSILEAVLAGRGEEAARLCEEHVGVSRIEVRKLTLHRLQSARSSE